MCHICVDLSNTNNKWIEFGLANVDTFIICIEFGLTNVDTIRTLTRHEHNSSTRIATPTYIHEEKSILAAAVGGYKTYFVTSSKIVIN